MFRRIIRSPPTSMLPDSESHSQMREDYISSEVNITNQNYSSDSRSNNGRLLSRFIHKFFSHRMIRLSHDNYVIVGSSQGYICVLSTKTGECKVQTFKRSSWIRDLLIINNSILVSMANTDILSFWDTSNLPNSLRHIKSVHIGNTRGFVGLIPFDETQVLIARKDGKLSKVQIVNNEIQIHRFLHVREEIQDISSFGNSMIVSTRTKVNVYNIQSKQLRLSFSTNANRVRINDNWLLAVVPSSDASVINVFNSTDSLLSRTIDSHRSYIWAIELIDNSSLIMSSSRDGYICLHRADDGSNLWKVRLQDFGFPDFVFLRDFTILSSGCITGTTGNEVIVIEPPLDILNDLSSKETSSKHILDETQEKSDNKVTMNLKETIESCELSTEERNSQASFQTPNFMENNEITPSDPSEVEKEVSLFLSSCKISEDGLTQGLNSDRDDNIDDVSFEFNLSYSCLCGHDHESVGCNEEFDYSRDYHSNQEAWPIETEEDENWEFESNSKF